MYKFFIVLFLFSMSVVNRSAASGTAGTTGGAIVRIDSTRLTLRHFDQKKIARYREQPEFIYDDAEPLDMSWWDRFWRWFAGLFKDTKVGNYKYAGSIMKYLVIGTLVALAVFLIVKIAGLDLRIIFGRSKETEVPYHESLENIHDINFNEQIAQAVEASNYRLAVRLLYLSTLKMLNDKDLIDWQPEKTNRIYIEELKNPHKKQLFKSLTTQFEYVWYGEFFIDKENFNAIKSLFDRFNSGKS